MDAFDRITTGNAARLLFCNPVCGLITTNPDGSHNGMTISWLTPADNHAAFILSMNARRHSRANLARDALFSLSVGVEGMEELLLALGSETGAEGPDVAVSATVVADAPGVTPAGAPAAPDKLTRLGAPLVIAVSASVEQNVSAKRARADDALLSSARALPALAASPARLVCRVRSELIMGSVEGGGEPVRGHCVLVCDVLAAWVRRDHWVGGKVFATPRGAPRLLCFQGSRVFAAIETRIPEDGSGAAAGGAGDGER